MKSYPRKYLVDDTHLAITMQESLDGNVDIFSKNPLCRDESPKLLRGSLELKKVLAIA